MHGQAKTVKSAADQEKETKRKQAKAKAYREAMTIIFERRNLPEFDDEQLQLTSDVLTTNPDVSTLWNIRKEVILRLRDLNSEELCALCPDELHLTEICLRANPKSYCAWYHRLWLINIVPGPDLKHELNLCNKYLKLDSRNFHCWDYRRTVAAKLGLSPKDELEYTMEKIEENFSNYSSWHYRSKLLPLVYRDPAGERPIEEDIHVQELDLVQNAAFTDPTDQSAWFYLRWLLGRLEPKLELVQFYLIEEIGKAFAVFNRPAFIDQDKLEIEMGGCDWRTVNKKKSCPVWQADFSRDIKTFLVSSLDKSLKENLVSEPGSKLTKDPNLSIRFWAKINGDKSNIVLTQSDEFFWTKNIQFEPEISPNLRAVLLDQLDACNQLLELEPDSKWTILTMVILMLAIDKIRYKEEILNKLEDLTRVDEFRKNYYLDLRSKYMSEMKLEQGVRSDSLSGLTLTALYHVHYLSHLDFVNLSNNRLQRSLPQLLVLVNCEILRLDGNELETLQGFPHLPNLRVLSLGNNKLKEPENIFPYLEGIKRLELIDLGNNPISEGDPDSPKSPVEVVRRSLPGVLITTQSAPS